MLLCSTESNIHKTLLPTLDLPYGRWRASTYDNSTDVYTFRNIRYAAPPTGKLRWAAPVSPESVKGVQDGSYGPACIQLPSVTFAGGLFTVTSTSEDCLFLDVYVPGNAIRGQTKGLAVVVWIYGGGFVTGSKDQLYNGSPAYNGNIIVERADGDAIFVAMNYRVGPLGWLAGTAMENEGLPNTGLHDQRAALQWIQDYIHLVGGDPSNVSVWGDSAGGGSIYAHLVAGGGSLDPLFHRAIIMSPGSVPIVSKSGTEDEYFETFADAVGCSGQGLECLRQANTSAVQQATIETSGLYWVPVPDGRYIKETPILEIAAGNYWKHLDSLIVSYTSNDGLSLIPEPPPANYIDSLATLIFPPNSSDLISKIIDAYNTTYSEASPLEIDGDFFGDLNTLCKVQSLVEAFPNQTYLAQYSVGNGTHGSDVIALFDIEGAGEANNPFFEWYESYFVSHALTGNPNILRNESGTINWPLVPDPNAVHFADTLNVTDNGFELIQNTKINTTMCSRWLNALASATSSIA
ncbi:hypothetical protein OIDMADRAFT_138895 [Oidiodendron maius Zn]|uniref:Carboxylesterase type B domain-containing protein n=1 Tax=Oidiodendron maius (strain Zn) TaxID=913774 RepID=A0A0C3CT49_OIDMZ|nr:hypothetical protein OIDMADRAFT_138895 [Oidiodendron maius Zn]